MTSDLIGLGFEVWRTSVGGCGVCCESNEWYHVGVGLIILWNRYAVVCMYTYVCTPTTVNTLTWPALHHCVQHVPTASMWFIVYWWYFVLTHMPKQQSDGIIAKKKALTLNDAMCSNCNMYCTLGFRCQYAHTSEICRHRICRVLCIERELLDVCICDQWYVLLITTHGCMDLNSNAWHTDQARPHVPSDQRCRIPSFGTFLCDVSIDNR